MIRVRTTITREPLMRRGYPERVVDGVLEDIDKQVARRTWQLVRQYLDRVLRHPTGHYESQVQFHKFAGGWVVDDGNVVYGPWLEGVGSRNSPVTRFRGYSHFRRAQQRMIREHVQIAERLLDREIRSRF